MSTQAINYNHQEDWASAGFTDANENSRLIKDTLIGRSRWAYEAQRLLAAHAAHDRPVILEGEPGTGKRFLARLIHQCSSLREGPFVSLALGATSDDLTRALLFGCAAPRSDDDSHCDKGLVELARGGTLYIYGLSSGARLLTDLIQFVEQSGTGDEGVPSVRILIGRGRSPVFYPQTIVGIRSSSARRSQGYLSSRADYERIQLPPLRERADDIEPLAGHFINQRCRQIGKEVRGFSPDAIRALRSYDWPQNVRELRTLVNHLVRQSDPPLIDMPGLPTYIAGSKGAGNLVPTVGVDLDHEVQRYEIGLICAALKQSHGLQKRAAQLLRIKPTTLFMRIRRYGINVEDFKSA